MPTRARQRKSRPTVQPPKGGRPTKLTPRVRLECVKMLSHGAPNAVAARRAGISYDSFNEYKKQGEYDASLLDALQFDMLVQAADAEVLGKPAVMQHLDESMFTPFAKFAVACERATAAFLEYGFGALMTNAPKSPQTVFGMFARLIPNEYGDPAVNLRVGNPDGSPIDQRPVTVIGRLIVPDNNRPVTPPAVPTRKQN